MTYGNFYVGKSGFQYKSAGGGGGRRNFPLGLITGVPANVNNKFVPGAGVGASSTATRRAKLIHATICSGNYPCSSYYPRLGMQVGGGSNIQGVNWFIGI